MGHVNPDKMIDYVDGALSADDLLRVGKHLAECRRCAQQAMRIRKEARFLDSWTPRAHGEAYVRNSGFLTRAEFGPRAPEPRLAAAGPAVAGDRVMAQIPAFVSDEEEKGEDAIWIDVTQKPRLSSSGILVIGIRTPRDLGGEFDLYVEFEGEEIGNPVRVKPGRPYEPGCELSNEQRDRWRDTENQPPDSWPLRFILRLPGP